MKTAGLKDLLRARDVCPYQTLNNLVQQVGPVYRAKIPGQRIVVIADPATMREFALTHQSRLVKGQTLRELTAMTRGLKTLTEADGDEWTRLRAPFQKAMAKDFVARALEKISGIMDEALLSLSRVPQVDLFDFTNRLAFHIACATLYSYRTDALDDLGRPHPYLEMQHYLVDQFLVRTQRGPWWKKLPLPSNRRVNRALDENRVFLMKILDGRRHSGENHGDFLDFLLTLKDQAGQPLSDDQLCVHMYGMIGASFESTGSILHWAMLEIGTRPELLQKIRAEVQRADLHNPQALFQMPQLRNSVFETLRLYPAFPMLMRECIEDIQQPVPVQKGEVVFMLMGAVQRNEKIWGADAGEFRPDRWQQLSSEQKAAYTPFGLGRRACLGESLGSGELPLVLGRILRDLDFEIVGGQVPATLLKFALGPRTMTQMKIQRVQKARPKPYVADLEKSL